MNLKCRSFVLQMIWTRICSLNASDVGKPDEVDCSALLADEIHSCVAFA